MDYPSSFLGEEPPAVSTPPRHTRRVEERKKAYPTRIKTGGIRLKKICGFALVRRKGRSYAVLCCAVLCCAVLCCAVLCCAVSIVLLLSVIVNTSFPYTSYTYMTYHKN